MLENVTEPVRFKRWVIMKGCEVVEGGEGGGGRGGGGGEKYGEKVRGM